MRAPRQRLADLRAQQAANRIGELRLGELCERLGGCELRAGMAEILAYSERRTRAALAELPDGSYRAEDVLEGDRNGEERDLHLRLEATSRGDSLRLDFSGSEDQVDGNLNCPLSVTKSAAFFAVRVLTDPDGTALGRRPPPDRGRGAPPAPSSTPASPPPSPPATSRPRVGSPTSSSRPSRRHGRDRRRARGR